MWTDRGLMYTYALLNHVVKCTTYTHNWLVTLTRGGRRLTRTKPQLPVTTAWPSAPDRDWPDFDGIVTSARCQQEVTGGKLPDAK
jgi:hypothetical protein